MEAIQQMQDLSRIWIFTASRELSDNEIALIREEATKFCLQWTAHKVALHAMAEVLHRNFLVIGVDEDKHGASGCSIDTMHAFIRNLGVKTGVDFFDRMRIVYLDKDNVPVNVSMNQFSQLFREGKTNPETLVFNALIGSGRDLSADFIIPVKNSWLSARLD
jgi:hypothetical protein